MKIGIVGTGNMGRVLGGLWAVKGHQVLFGARQSGVAEEAAQLARAQGAQNATAGTNDDAARFGDVLVYSARGVDIRTVVSDPTTLDDTIVVDLNNHAIPDGFEFEPVSVSLAEHLQEQAPRALVVKAFNTLGMEVLEAQPESLQAAQVSVYIATDHARARKAVEALVVDLNLRPVNAGPLRNARLLESAADLVRYLAIGAKLGQMTTINMAVVSQAGAERFGGRRASTLGRDPLSSPQPDQVTVEASRIIDAPIDRLWAEVASFNDVAVWHPDVTESQLEAPIAGPSGNSAGQIRVIKLRNGTIVRERLVEIDPQAHSYAYSVLDGQLPLKAHISHLTMRPVDGPRTQVTWDASFTPAGAPAAALADGVRSDVLELGLKGLADRVRQAA